MPWLAPKRKSGLFYGHLLLWRESRRQAPWQFLLQKIESHCSTQKIYEIIHRSLLEIESSRAFFSFEKYMGARSREREKEWAFRNTLGNLMWFLLLLFSILFSLTIYEPAITMPNRFFALRISVPEDWGRRGTKKTFLVGGRNWRKKMELLKNLTLIPPKNVWLYWHE